MTLDPFFAAPHAGLAVSWFFHITHGFVDDLSAALLDLYVEASEAVALDQRDSLAHTVLGLAFMERGEFGKAIPEHRIALDLNPNSSFAHGSLGYALQRAQSFEEALVHFDLALRLSPRDPAACTFLSLKASVLYELKRYEEAARFAEEAARHPVAYSVWPYVHLAAALGQLDRKDEARKALEELYYRRPGLTVSKFMS